MYFRILLFVAAVNLTTGALSVQANEVVFNTDLLDVNDSKNIDMSRFSQAGYIMPGDYEMSIYVNKQQLQEQIISFYEPEVDSGESRVCLTHELVEQLGLKSERINKLTWWNDNKCLDVKSLNGISIKGDLANSTLYIGLPQAYLEYASVNWEPPARWDNGISGVLLDYNIITQLQHQYKNESQDLNTSGNGTIGANMGAWRLRADWQSFYNTDQTQSSRSNWEWSRYYAYRAIPSLGSRLMMGEIFTTSDIFDSFRFAGASLNSDNNMLPPNLRGYAPEVAGIAKTNAKVIISQQGRVLQETQVAVGPFRIQDISSTVSGQLDVEVQEQDGSVQTFSVSSASIPYLTRPGSVRFKIATGKAMSGISSADGPLFASGEFTWGVNNGWSLYGGTVNSEDYNALALGLGRDLQQYGALSFDTTRSYATLPYREENLSGNSFRLSYSKHFDEYNTQIAFAGYRFSQLNYMSMSEYLDASKEGNRSHNNKEMYSITLNKQFRDSGLSTYLMYSHQNYWNTPAKNNYSITLANYVDIGPVKRVNISLTAYRNQYNQIRDNGMYLSLSIPLGKGHVSYNSSFSQGNNNQQVNYSGQINERNNYQLGSGIARDGVITNGYINHNGELIRMSANAGYQAGHYAAVGMSFAGGITGTANGAALHSSGMMGGTRMMLDTDGVAGIPVHSYGASIKSNRFGKAVLTNMASFQRGQVSVDLNKLPDDVDLTRSVMHATLTEGAIGYRKFEVVSGRKFAVVIRMADGASPPFGAIVMNKKNQNIGIVSDDGNAWLSGINGGDSMVVNWEGQAQCELKFPNTLPTQHLATILLPCNKLTLH